MLLAPRALSEQRNDTRLTVNGAEHKGDLNRILTAAEMKDGVLTISNEGDAGTDAVISVIGAPLTPEPAGSKGFTIERTYYTLDGKLVVFTLRETFKVRKISFGVGVERTFPVHSPIVEKIEVAIRGDVRRAKLYYLRDRIGKAAKVKEKRV